MMQCLIPLMIRHEWKDVKYMYVVVCEGWGKGCGCVN